MNKYTSFFAVMLTAFSFVPSQAQTAGSVTTTAVTDLKRHLEQDSLEWSAIAEQPFAAVSLSKLDTQSAKKLLIEARRQQLLKARADEMKAMEITLGEKKMPLFSKTFGDKPAGSRSLFISMHGGGGAPKRVNDSQWNNQKRLYKPTDGVYVAPRAPTDTWNLWHEAHIMPMFDRLIENMVLFEGVDPNRVYVMGYSAGGDGVYQLAPRMADRWAAAAMMAGHPNDAKPQNLRNIGFTLFMGGKDAAYKRNQVAAEWGEKLAALQKADPSGYKHLVTIYPDKGHWMDGEDASALAWMSKFSRNTRPTKVVWRKDSQPQARFYWLGADPNDWKAGETVTAELVTDDATTIQLTTKPEGLSLLLCDELVDLDKELTISWEGGSKTLRPQRTIAAIHQCITQRFDPTSVFTSVVDCDAL